MRTASILLSALTLLAATAHAQIPGAPAGPPRSYIGGGLTLTQPVGEFSHFVDEAIGFGASFVYRFGSAGVLGLRADGDFINYGRERRAVLISSTIGGRITADLETNNNIGSFGIGPQVTLPLGFVQPYGYGTGGFSYFNTVSSLKERRGGNEILSTTNFDDAVLSWSAGGGLYIPVTHGRTPIAIDLGARFRRNSDVQYLREGDIEDLPGGNIRISPVRSDADFVVYHLGISVGLRATQRDDRR